MRLGVGSDRWATLDNPALTSIAGLGNLKTVNGDLSLEDLDNLPNLNELTSLTTVTGTCFIVPISLLATAPDNVKEACGFTGVPPPAPPPSSPPPPLA